jgi:MOSC domain-containing protein YiiM
MQISITRKNNLIKIREEVFRLAGEIVGLSIFLKKGEPGVTLPEINLLKGLGVEGSFRQGGERQVTLLSAEIRRWINEHSGQGLCFGRFKENILFEGLPLEAIKPGGVLSVGNAVIRISTQTKPCFDECPLFLKGTPCLLSGRAVFAVVEQSGTVREGDKVILL